MSRLVMGLQSAREVLRVRGGDCEVLIEVTRGAPNPKLEGLERLATTRGSKIRKISGAELDRMAKGGRHQGIIVIAPELEVLAKEDLLAAVDADPLAAHLVLALDGLMDPQNFGAAVRSAVALGADYVLWPEHSSAPLSSAMFRASAGAVEHAKLVRVRALPDVLHELARRAFSVVLLDAQGESSLDQVDLTGAVALVIGAEDKGARGPVRKAATVAAHLPMSGKLDSLNASVAAGLALYETVRQRRAVV